MTEFRISVYYKKYLPQYFKNSLMQVLENAIEATVIDGYEFQEYTEQGEKKDEKRIKASASRPDKSTKQGTTERNGEGSSGGVSVQHKEVRSNRADNSQKKRK